MSYQRLTQVTRPFAFLAPGCDDELQDIDTEASYFIYLYMYSGYFQVVVEEDARKILASFTPDRKRRWKLMPMGVLNVAPMFVEIMVKLQMEWVILYKDRGLKMLHKNHC